MCPALLCRTVSARKVLLRFFFLDKSPETNPLFFQCQQNIENIELREKILCDFQTHKCTVHCRVVRFSVLKCTVHCRVVRFSGLKCTVHCTVEWSVFLYWNSTYCTWTGYARLDLQYFYPIFCCHLAQKNYSEFLKTNIIKIYFYYIL